MDSSINLTDEVFVSFLRSLGAETYDKSFEWMLNDPAIARIARWLYNNLDHNNALSAREEYRYAELEKAGRLLSPEKLESAVNSIQERYNGICLTGDKDQLEGVKSEICMQKEKLSLLEKHEDMINSLINQKEELKMELTVDLTNLKSAEQQWCTDEKVAGDECLNLAEEVETITEDVVAIIANTLEMYGNAHVDKDIAKKFLAFGPLEAYRQTQALFRSHYDLYTSKKISKRQSNSITDEDLRAALFVARNLEDRLSDALCAYVESKAELQGEQAKLVLVTNYTAVHPSQVAIVTVEAQSSLELLIQEESILDQQIQDAIKDLVNSRTRMAVDATMKAAIAVREQIHTDLAHLLDTSQQVLALDKLLYYVLRHELRTVEECAQFAARLRELIVGEDDAQVERIEAMNKIIADQDACTSKLQSTDVLLNNLYKIIGAEPSNDAMLLVKLFSDLQSKIKELKVDLDEGFKKKEEGLSEVKKSLQPLQDCIWNGATKQPNFWNPSVAALTDCLTNNMKTVEGRLLDFTSKFTIVKNSDKQNIRKLWQWFLTDENKLLDTVKGIESYYRL